MTEWKMVHVRDDPLVLRHMWLRHGVKFNPPLAQAEVGALTVSRSCDEEYVKTIVDANTKMRSGS